MPVANGSELSCLFHPSWRHPNGTTQVFDPALAEALIRRHNETGGTDITNLDTLLRHIEPLAKSIVEYRGSTRHEELDELLSRVRLKLWKSLRLYDPA
jgi:hypothetical protein